MRNKNKMKIKKVYKLYLKIIPLAKMKKIVYNYLKKVVNSKIVVIAHSRLLKMIVKYHKIH